VDAAEHLAGLWIMARLLPITAAFEKESTTGAIDRRSRNSCTGRALPSQSCFAGDRACCAADPALDQPSPNPAAGLIP